MTSHRGPPCAGSLRSRLHARFARPHGRVPASPISFALRGVPPSFADRCSRPPSARLPDFRELPRRHHPPATLTAPNHPSWRFPSRSTRQGRPPIAGCSATISRSLAGRARCRTYTSIRRSAGPLSRRRAPETSTRTRQHFRGDPSAWPRAHRLALTWSSACDRPHPPPAGGSATSSVCLSLDQPLLRAALRTSPTSRPRATLPRRVEHHPRGSSAASSAPCTNVVLSPRAPAPVPQPDASGRGDDSRRARQLPRSTPRSRIKRHPPPVRKSSRRKPTSLTAQSSASSPPRPRAAPRALSPSMRLYSEPADPRRQLSPRPARSPVPQWSPLDLPTCHRRLSPSERRRTTSGAIPELDRGCQLTATDAARWQQARCGVPRPAPAAASPAPRRATAGARHRSAASARTGTSPCVPSGVPRRRGGVGYLRAAAASLESSPSMSPNHGQHQKSTCATRCTGPSSFPQARSEVVGGGALSSRASSTSSAAAYLDGPHDQFPSPSVDFKTTC